MYTYWQVLYECIFSVIMIAYLCLCMPDKSFGKDSLPKIKIKRKKINIYNRKKMYDFQLKFEYKSATYALDQSSLYQCHITIYIFRRLLNELNFKLMFKNL